MLKIILVCFVKKNGLNVLSHLRYIHSFSHFQIVPRLLFLENIYTDLV